MPALIFRVELGPLGKVDAPFESVCNVTATVLVAADEVGTTLMDKVEPGSTLTPVQTTLLPVPYEPLADQVLEPSVTYTPVISPAATVPLKFTV